MQQVLIYLLLNLPTCKPGIHENRPRLHRKAYPKIRRSLTKAEFLEPNHTIFGGDIASSIMMMDTLIKLQSAEFGDLTVSFFILFGTQKFYKGRGKTKRFEYLRLSFAVG